MTQLYPYDETLSYHLANLALVGEIQPIWEAADPRNPELDDLFSIPRQGYGLVFFLGILYQLQNPYYALKALARATRYCLISTRIAQVTTDRGVRFADVPVAYLVAPTETNNDSTNYWIFSDAGLRRILDRTGWEIVDYMTVGAAVDSDPASSDRDERAFCLVRSRG